MRPFKRFIQKNLKAMAAASNDTRALLRTIDTQAPPKGLKTKGVFAVGLTRADRGIMIASRTRPGRACLLRTPRQSAAMISILEHAIA